MRFRIVSRLMYPEELLEAIKQVLGEMSMLVCIVG